MSDGEDKKQLRTLIEQFLSRAEEIKAMVAQQQELLQYYQRNSVDLTASSLQQLQLDNTSAPNSNSVPNSNINHTPVRSEVASAVQQLEAIQVPADPPKKVLGRLARTSVALPGTSQSMTPVNVTSAATQNMTPVNVMPSSNGALPGQMSGANNSNYMANSGVNNHPANNNGAYNNYAANNSLNNNSAANNYVSSTNPWASAVNSPNNNYASPYQPASPYNNTGAHNTTSASPYNNITTSPYNHQLANNNYPAPTSPHTPQLYPNTYAPSSPYTPSNPYTSPYNPNTGAAYATPSLPYTPSSQHYTTSPRNSQHYASPAPYSPAPYNNLPYAPGPYANTQHNNGYPLPYAYSDHAAVSQYHTSPQQYHGAAQPYYDPQQSYNMQHSAYPVSGDSCYTSPQSNPWGNYSTSSCDPCDPCTVNYQYTQGLPPMSASVTPVNMSQVQYSPVMSNTAVQSWPQQYATQFTDLNQFINTNNLTTAVPQPDKDREKIILYFVSKGFQRQHVESSYDYLRKMNLQVNADFVEILKDALLVYPTTGSTSGTATTPAASALPSNLLNEVNTLPRPQWVSDDKAPQCKICAAPFTLLFRRHHCRGCGNVVCALCSDKEVPLPKYVSLICNRLVY